MRERLKRFLYPLGHYIKQSVALFFSGLVLFGVGLALLWHNPSEDSWLGYGAVILITIALLLALIGWLGILAYRISHIINRVEQSQSTHR
jgi:protein-S-isoprenylcysteine O-methyltransferase Ste14